MPDTPVLSAEEQRMFQANALKLPASASWTDIREEINHKSVGAIFLDKDDWYGLMVDLYGTEIFHTEPAPA